MNEFDKIEAQQQPMSVKDWLITLIIIAIPVVGIVMLFVYAFGESDNINKKNWAKAQLILIAIVLVLVIFAMLSFGALFASGMANQ
jgi:cation transporter-like permease